MGPKDRQATHRANDGRVSDGAQLDHSLFLPEASAELRLILVQKSA